jgi:hypothetical protein
MRLDALDGTQGGVNGIGMNPFIVNEIADSGHSTAENKLGRSGAGSLSLWYCLKGGLKKKSTTDCFPADPTEALTYRVGPSFAAGDRRQGKNPGPFSLPPVS